MYNYSETFYRLNPLGLSNPPGRRATPGAPTHMIVEGGGGVSKTKKNYFNLVYIELDMVGNIRVLLRRLRTSWKVTFLRSA